MVIKVRLEGGCDCLHSHVVLLFCHGNLTVIQLFMKLSNYQYITQRYCMMCDMYRNIDISFNIMILLGVSMQWNGQQTWFSHLSNFISKSNYNKLVCITLIDFFYHFLTNTTKLDFYKHFNYYFK